MTFTPHKYNAMPENWREVSPNDFYELHSAFAYYMSNNPGEFRQIIYDEKGEKLDRVISCVLFHGHDNTGVALEHYYAGNGEGWVRWYRFGCDHDMKPVTDEEAKSLNILPSVGYYHVSKCTKCGYTHGVDSSD